MVDSKPLQSWTLMIHSQSFSPLPRNIRIAIVPSSSHAELAILQQYWKKKKYTNTCIRILRFLHKIIIHTKVVEDSFPTHQIITGILFTRETITKHLSPCAIGPWIWLLAAFLHSTHTQRWFLSSLYLSHLLSIFLSLSLPSSPSLSISHFLPTPPPPPLSPL